MTESDPVLTTVRISVTIDDPTATRYEVARVVDINTEDRPTPGDVFRAIAHVTSDLLNVLRSQAPEERQEARAVH